MAEAGASFPVLRVARASADLAAARRFYVDALGLTVFGAFADHDGFDGLIVGLPGAVWHLELVCERGAAVMRPSPEDLLVLYEPDAVRHSAWVAGMRHHGFDPVPARNPYWNRHGCSFEDADGYRIVLAQISWPR